MLIDGLQDPHWYVRVAAADALASEGRETGVSELIVALQDDHWYVRSAAHAALKAMTRKEFGADAAEWQRWQRGQ